MGRTTAAMQPLHVIWNPNAGTRERNAAALEQLRQGADPFQFHVTESEADSVERVRHLLSNGTRQLAACGGDGVINVVADTVLKSGRGDLIFSVLPLGTGNDYARSLGLPLSPVEAAALAFRGETRALDVFHVSGEGIDRFGVNMLAAGNTGQYTRQLCDDVKQQWGPFCFLRGAIDVLQNLEVYPVRVQFDDGPWKSYDVLNLFVANGRCAGAGLPIAPGALLDDGWLDVVLVLDGTAIQLADLALQYVLADHREHELIVCRRVRSVRFECATPLVWAVDGQDFTAQNLTVTVAPHRLTVVLGTESPAVTADEPSKPPY